jgi:ribosomal protein S18 acetylase RimI-like enzyme
MTSSLTACLKKSGDLIAPADRAAILARSRDLRGEGQSAHAAAKQAVSERLELVKTELNQAVRATLKKPDAFDADMRAQPFDHGELNIPGRTKNINRDLDRYKAEQERVQKADAKQAAAKRKDDKARAKEVFAEVWPAMLEKMGPKFGEKQLRETLDSMVKWEPAKFLAMAEKFRKEQGGKDAFDTVMRHRAFHGTPHDFDRFTTEAIGSGEGAQAYGWGLYFAENEKVAGEYQRKLSADHRGDTAVWSFNGKRTTLNDFIQGAPQRHAGLEERDAQNAAFLASEYVIGHRETPNDEKLQSSDIGRAIAADMQGLKRTTGALFQVDIPDEVVARMLLWDKPLSEQPESVRRALKLEAAPPLDVRQAGSGWEVFNTATGEVVSRNWGSEAGARRMAGGSSDARQNLNGAAFYKQLTEERGSQEAASKHMESIGIPGIRYLDGGSRNRPLKQVKREFLAQLPEDADFNEVLDLIGSGTFSPENEAILKALAENDWLGFDYPSQAISAALSPDLANYDASDALVKAVEEAQKDATYNLVVFNDKNVTITHKDGSPVTKAERDAFMDEARGRGDTARRRSDQTPDGQAAAEADRAIRTARAPRKAEVQRIVDDLTSSWKDKPQITVVESVDELEGDHPADTRGLYSRGHVWIVAGAPEHRTRAGIARTLAHEAIAHHGLRNMLGREAWNRLMRDIQLGIRSKNKALLGLQKEVRAAYVDENGNFELSEAEEADEIAAKAVEEAIDADGNFRPGFAFLKAVFARVGQFLRERGIDVTFTNAELQGMLVLSMRNMEQGQRTAGGGRMVLGGSPAARARTDAQKAAAWQEVTETEFGPEYSREGLQLLPLGEKDTSTDLGENSLPLGHGAHVAPGNKVFDFAIARDGELVGRATLEVGPDGQIAAVHDIVVNGRRKGVGRAVMEAILASAKGPIRIIDIVPAAEAFWDKMGTGAPDAYSNATTDWQSYQATRPKQGGEGRGARNDAQAEQGRAGQGNAPSEGEAGGFDGTLRGRGDNADMDYRGQHQAPGRGDGAPAHDLTGNSVYPDDIYSINGLRYYGTGSDLDAEAYSTLASLRGRPNRSVTIYRAVPHQESEAEELGRLESETARYQARRVMPKGMGGRSGFEGESAWYEQAATRRDELREKAEAGTIEKGKRLTINPGDWVTISRKYAQEHGEANLNGKFKIVSKTVRAKDIYTAGDSFLEWGYDPQAEAGTAAAPSDAFDGSQRARGGTAAANPDEDAPAPAPNPTSPWRDPTGRLQFAPGAWLYEKIGKAAGPLLTKLQMKAASPELKRMLREMKLQVAKAQETAGAVATEAMKLSEDERAMVSDIVEQELAAGTIPPAHALRLAAMINSTMGAQTDELVRLGMLTEDSADMWRGKYLPRYYKNKLGKQVGDAWADAVGKMFGRTRTMAGIKGKHLRGRGLYESVQASEVAEWESLGWEVRDPDSPAGTGAEISQKILSGDLAPEDTVQVWRDFSREERENMGEIRDAGFRFVMGYMQTQRDIALGRLFEELAGNPEMSGKKETADFTIRVPDGTVTGTGAKRYGKLAGRWVSKDTFSHLTQIEESQSEAWKMYRKALALWKEGKVALNPVSHVNNMVSNLTMAHFAGVSYLRADKYIAAAKDFATKAAGVQEAKDAGLFLGTMSDAELMNVLPEDLKALVKQQDSAASKIGSSAFNVMTFWLRKPMGWAYQAEDTFFRYLIYKDARGRGMEPGDAVDYAQKYIFAYDDLPKGARMIRDFGIPFFAYTYKAVPALLHTALTHPIRMAAPAAVLWGINAAAYAIAAGDDEDDWLDTLQKYINDPEFRQQAREKEKLEREHLPEWMKGSTSLGTPKAIRLGMDEVTKLPLFIDTSRIVPGGDLFDVNPNGGGIPWIQPLTPSNPLLTTYMAMFGNKDAWFGKEVVDTNDTRGEAAAKRAEWLWKQASPAVAFGNYHWERGMNALAQATGQEIRWAPEAVAPNAVVTGIGRDGLPVQPKLAAMQTFGIKVRPIDLETSEAIENSLKQKMIRDIDTEMRRLRRLSGKGAISDQVYEREFDKAQEKKDRLRSGLTVDGDEKN